jgi:hypothetical protein
MWRDWFRWLEHRRRPALSPPPPPAYPSGLIRAQAELAKADDTLTRLQAQEPEVEALASKAAAIHRQNNLGPAFMRALGTERRA